MQSLKRAFNRVMSTTDLTQPGTSQSKRSKTNTDNKQADIIEEIFNTVLSQGVEGDNNGANPAVYNGEFDAEEMEEMEEEAYLCTDHEEHCSLRIEVRRLFRVIQLQRQHIEQLDAKLNHVISFVGLQREKPNNNATVRTGGRGPAQSTGGSTGNAGGRQNGLQQRNQTNRSSQNKTAQRSAQRPERHTEAANGTNRAGNGRHAEESTDAHTTRIIHRTINDISRRKQNVIVSGLPEDDLIDDQTAFHQLCTNDLSITPAVVSCTRLGVETTGRPRRLLVKLRSEESAAALLRVAPALRQSEDLYISTLVYINPDLSPTAAKLAYEKRQRRREARQQEQQQQHEEEQKQDEQNMELTTPSDNSTSAAAVSGGNVKQQTEIKSTEPDKTIPADGSTIKAVADVHVSDQ